MAEMLFAFMIVAVIVITMGMLSSTAFNIRGRILTKRVCALYF